MSAIKKYTGWAINFRSKEEHGLMGRYYWFSFGPISIPKHMNGHLTALYCTRKEAREVLPAVKRAFPDARVEKAYVTIRTK